jgi:hypothetical protein
MIFESMAQAVLDMQANRHNPIPWSRRGTRPPDRQSLDFGLRHPEQQSFFQRIVPAAAEIFDPQLYLFSEKMQIPHYSSSDSSHSGP